MKIKYFRLFVYVFGFGLGMSCFEGRSQTMIPIGPHLFGFPDFFQTPGVWFEAPVDFTITGLRIPEEAGYGFEPQFIHVIRINDAVPADGPNWSTNITSLQYIANAPFNVIQTVNIPVQAGQKIGILARLEGGGQSRMGTGTPYISSIGTATVTLKSLHSPDNIEVGPATEYGTTELADGIRMEIYYTLPPSCVAPATLSSADIKANTALLDWTQAGTAAQWQVRYSIPGFDPLLTGADAWASATPYALNNLRAASDYDWYVRAVCAPGDTSAWSAVAGFRTCDSIFSVKADTICPGGVYLFGTQTLTAAGGYDEIFASATGNCDSMVHLDLSIRQIDTIVTQSGPVLTAQEDNAAYQWLDCNDNLRMIPGATGRDYTATTSGLFAVAITTGGCSDTSGCYPVILAPSSGVPEAADGSRLRIYPNPGNGVFTVMVRQPLQQASLRLTNLLGQTLETRTQLGDQTFTVDLTGRAEGVYLLSITDGDNTYAGHLIKK